MQEMPLLPNKPLSRRPRAIDPSNNKPILTLPSHMDLKPHLGKEWFAPLLPPIK